MKLDDVIYLGTLLIISDLGCHEVDDRKSFSINLEKYVPGTWINYKYPETFWK